MVAGSVLRNRSDLRPKEWPSHHQERAPGEKASAYHYIDGSREAFSLRVDGDFPGAREDLGQLADCR
jgi:hypothetical protein